MLGYAALIDCFGLDVLKPAGACYLLERGHRRSQVTEGRRAEYFPPRDNPGATWTDQLLFALRQEGVNLEVLAAVFQAAPKAELSAWIRSAPTSRYARLAWFLYEWLLGHKLPLPDLTQGNYVPVLDGDDFYAPSPVGTTRHVRRQRVINNLPGTRDYCPLIRRTAELRAFEALRLDEQAAAQVRRFPVELVNRAAQYLYLKETKSSYALEHLAVDQRRTARFVALLQQTGRVECFDKPELIRLQNAIVEERYAARDYRDFQNYVGQSLGPARELVHYVPPRPEDLATLMEGWMTCCRNLQGSGVHPVITATVAGFGFVFLHPFEDGNGRLHRFLIHHVLVAGSFGPAGVSFPVSATMLKRLDRYDATLEVYSQEIGRHVEYRLDAHGSMRVTNATAAFYRYPDLTAQAEALFGFIRDTIQFEMIAELEWLAAFDGAQRRLREVVDMPDQRLNLFLRVCLQGRGQLSKGKRGLFAELTPGECQRMEKIVQRAIKALPTLAEE
jgi:hypothetical protein